MRFEQHIRDIFNNVHLNVSCIIIHILNNKHSGARGMRCVVLPLHGCIVNRKDPVTEGFVKHLVDLPRQEADCCTTAEALTGRGPRR